MTLLQILMTRNLSGTARELLSEEQELNLVVHGQDSSTCNSTEDVGTGSLEERLHTLLGNNLLDCNY